MKSKILYLACLSAGFVLYSCKKEASTTPPPQPPPPPPPVIVNPDPELLGPETSKILHYPFNGNLNDASGNNLNALDSNNIIYTTDRLGRTSQAIVFGSNELESHIVTPSLSAEEVNFPFSLSFWFKADNVTRSQTIVKSDGLERAGYTGFWAQLGVTGEGSMAFSFGDNTGTSGSSRNTLITPNIFSIATWYHVVINVRGANDMDLYVNGVKNDNSYYDGYAGSIVFAEPATNGVLGIYDGAYSNYGGALDDYRIYKRILSQEEVSALYNFQP